MGQGNEQETGQGRVEIDGAVEDLGRQGDMGEPFLGWFTTGAACREIGISTQYMDRLIADNKCRADFIRTPYGRLFEPGSIQRWKTERHR